MTNDKSLFKFSSEACLNVFSVDDGYIFPVEALYEIDEDTKQKLADSHIYTILSRPKYLIDSIVIHENGINCEVVDYNGNPFFYAENLTFFSVPINYKDLAIKIDSTKTKIVIEGLSKIFPDANCDCIQVDVDGVIRIGCKRNNEPYELEVLYIGQAQGRENARGAIERLENHKTLQRIVIEYQSKAPDKRIFVMLFKFAEQQIVIINGRDSEFQTDAQADNIHFKEIVKDAIEISTLSPENRMRQIINITEAAMICYFKPKYNERLISNFPSPQHTSYKHYYNLEYNMVNIELGLDNIVLKSDYNKISSEWDYIQFELFKDERRNIFDIFKPKNVNC